MSSDPESICPHCGQPIRSTGETAPARMEHEKAEPHPEAGHGGVPLEYDHRGKLLPRRTRMGGIIAPQ